jgi:hypothetical protein
MLSDDSVKAPGRHWEIVLACVLVSLSLSISARAQERGPDASPTQDESEYPVTHRQQRDHYLFGTFGPPGLIGAALTSGFLQWRDVPREWGKTREGYAKRFASEYAESSISGTTRYLFARGLDEDPSFRPCECTGLHHRLRHASLGPISARKPDGRIVFSMATVAGVATGEAVANTWYPGPHPVRRLAKHVAIDFAGQLGVDLLREFVLHRHSGR